MTKRKPLEWLDTEWGDLPDCDECAQLMFSPLFVEAVHSIGIENGGDAGERARRTIDHYHLSRHKEWT